MAIQLPSFEVFQTATFEKQFSKLDQSVQAQIKKAIIEKLSDRPNDLSIPLSGQTFAGMRRMRVGKFRVIFIICGECRNKNIQTRIGCKDCNTHSNSTIMLLSCDKRSVVYDR